MFVMGFGGIEYLRIGFLGRARNTRLFFQVSELHAGWKKGVKVAPGAGRKLSRQDIVVAHHTSVPETLAPWVETLIPFVEVLIPSRGEILAPSLQCTSREPNPRGPMGPICPMGPMGPTQSMRPIGPMGPIMGPVKNLTQNKTNSRNEYSNLDK